MSEPAHPDPDPVHDGRRWPLGALSLLGLVAVVVVTVVVVLARGGDDAPDLTVVAGTLATLPPLTVPDVADEGEVAADFAVDLYDGSRFVLSEHLATDGRPVFLNLWASWCVPCRNEMPAIDAAADRYPGVYFLGIAVEDDPQAAEAFAEELGVDYPLGFDETDQVSVAYPHFGLPATFLIGEDGTLAGRVFGEVTESQIDELLAGVIG